ncbi:MFS transporter [Hyphomonas johnsonii]|uniref:Sugar (Glycoside-Pentoside-Hexuronide) transporter n=1 Tax=Hyphomonas johnsonii MHS-2 TaxID=1280950 RepID=A0A059FSN3_9PROT|nr:MFS transporter [Hyphomonas johnsonii]KCZ93468.1 sugar (Glycoside-Pentoside-Hexuronide) transporter [Hyphomonas johnsonii MHS-2]
MTTSSPLRLRHILGWSSGGFAVAVYLGVTINYFLFFLTQGATIPVGMASMVLLLPRLWDVVTDPIMGAISDRTRGRAGRRRPWILFGGLVFAVSFYFMFAIPDFDAAWQRAVWVTGFYMLVGTGYTMFEVPLNAMLPEMSQDYRQRARLAGYNMIAIRTGLIATMLVGPYIFAADADVAAGFRRIGLFAAVVIAVASIVVFTTTGDAPRVERPHKKFHLRQELSALWKNKPFKVLFCAHLLKFTGIGAAGTCVIYYLVFVLKAPPQSVGVVLSATAATATLFLPLWMWLMQKWGKKQAYSAALLILSFAMLPLLFVQPDAFDFSFKIPFVAEAVNGAVIAVAGILILASLGDSGAILAPNAMIPDTVEADELQSGTRREGTILGAWTFSRKLGMALGAYVVSLMLGWSGFVPGATSQSPEALNGIRLGYVLFPVSCYIAAWLILRKYTLSEARFEEIKADLVGRAER